MNYLVYLFIKISKRKHSSIEKASVCPVFSFVLCLRVELYSGEIKEVLFSG